MPAGGVSNASRHDRAAGDFAEAATRLMVERSGVGGHFLTSMDVERFTATAAMLDPAVVTVLDVGCGLGVLTDALAEVGYEALGVDIDRTLLVHVQAPTAEASIADLPFSDGAFDAVIANEVLEHLPADSYELARTELARVAAKQVIITVPNCESLQSATTKCPQCWCVYSVHGHVRRFDDRLIERILPGWELRRLGRCGPYKRRHASVEWVVRRRLFGRWPTMPEAQCPQCGYTQPGHRPGTESTPAGVSSRAINLLVGFPWQRWWTVADFRPGADRE